LVTQTRVHVILTDKSNSALLSAPQTLLDWGLTLADADCLEDAVPKTRLVSSEDATVLWGARHQLFKSRSPVTTDSKGVCQGDNTLNASCL